MTARGDRPRALGPVFSEGARRFGDIVADDGKRAAVAEELRITESFVSMLMYGHRQPSLELAYRIQRRWPRVAMSTWCEPTKLPVTVARSTQSDGPRKVEGSDARAAE